MVEKCLSIDNRRNRFTPFSRFVIFPDTTVLKPQLITDINPKTLAGYRVIEIIGGDGTAARALNELAQMEEDPAIYLAGGGSANTLLKGLKTTPQVVIPSYLLELFPSALFEAHLYRPPQIISDQDQETIAYLAAPDHLAVCVTKIYEQMVARGLARNVHLAYIAAGLFSFFKLRGRVEPRDIIPPLGVDRQKIAVASILAVPILGTIKLPGSIPPDKVGLISVTAYDEMALLNKYLRVLLIGSLPHGVDKLIKLGLMQLNYVDKVSVTPDPVKSPNACIDGQLRTLNGKVEITRSQKEKLIIVSKNSIFKVSV